jgi:hypothetical protein
MRGHLTRRGKNSWRFKYDVPGNGKRVTNWVTLHGNKKQAEAEAAKIVASLATGLHVDPSTETVAAFVERWLNDWAAANVSSLTLEGYQQMLRKHLSARVGSVPIQKLRAADLQAVYAAMAKDGLADRTRLHLHRVVHVMLKHATQWGWFRATSPTWSMLRVCVRRRSKSSPPVKCSACSNSCATSRSTRSPRWRSPPG